MKHLYIAAVAALLLSACGESKDYDNYVATLAAQPAVIDTISSPRSYGAYIDSLRTITGTFEALGIKLDDAQHDELQALGLKISKAMEAKYHALMAADTIQADNSVVTVSDGDAPAL